MKMKKIKNKKMKKKKRIDEMQDIVEDIAT